MNESGKLPVQVLTWSSGLAIILFCLTGVASMMGWLPVGQDGPVLPAVPEGKVEASKGAAQADCPSCGVVAAVCILDAPDDDGFMAGLVSSSGVLGTGLVTLVSGEDKAPVDQKAVMHYQTTVRFGNGSVRAFTDKSEPKLQVGERVRVTDGIVLRTG